MVTRIAHRRTRECEQKSVRSDDRTVCASSSNVPIVRKVVWHVRCGRLTPHVSEDVGSSSRVRSAPSSSHVRSRLPPPHSVARWLCRCRSFRATTGGTSDVSSAPLDPASAAYITFINNGSTRRLHPDFGGEASPGSVSIYGFPYVVVDGTQPKRAVQFQYSDESDGVEPHDGSKLSVLSDSRRGDHPAALGRRRRAWQRRSAIVATAICSSSIATTGISTSCTTSSTMAPQWHAGSGAFFDLNTNGRRPDGWTSADAAGSPFCPGSCVTTRSSDRTRSTTRFG